MMSLGGCGNTQKQISDEEINTLLQGRKQIDLLLRYSSLDYDAESKVSLNGIDYYRVTDEKYDEWSEWSDYVKSIYSDDSAELIFGDTKIIDIDGETYTNDGCEGNDLSDDYTYEIISSTDETAAISLKNTDNFTSATVETEINFVNTSNGWRIKIN